MQTPSIQPFSPIRLDDLTKTSKPTGSAENPGKTFQDILNSLSQSENNVDQLSESFAAGGDVDIHQIMIAAEENDINFRVAMGIRDRLVDAYREVMRMSV